jgi:hypothetical protein
MDTMNDAEVCRGQGACRREWHRTEKLKKKNYKTDPVSTFRKPQSQKDRLYRRYEFIINHLIQQLQNRQFHDYVERGQ